MTQETIKVTHRATQQIETLSHWTYLKYSNGKVTRYITYKYELDSTVGPELEVSSYPAGLIWVKQDD